MDRGIRCIRNNPRQTRTVGRQRPGDLQIRIKRDPENFISAGGKTSFRIKLPEHNFSARALRQNTRAVRDSSALEPQSPLGIAGSLENELQEIVPAVETRMSRTGAGSRQSRGRSRYRRERPSGLILGLNSSFAPCRYGSSEI